MTSHLPFAQTDRDPVPLRPFPGVSQISHAPLPISLTSFVGREHEVAAVGELVLRPDVRLVTLTGPGGVGKTRLALQVAEEVASGFADGVALVDLAPVRYPDHVARVVAGALGLTELPGQDPAETVKAYLRDRSFLLILDNFEHLLPAAPLATTWLSSCSRLTILTTSRAVLRVSGEHDFSVDPLAVPDLDVVSANQVMADMPAIQLFVERARAARADFTLTPDSSATVAAICARLDGLPLAIELAAARIQHLSPRVLLSRLDKRLPLLTGGPLDQPARLQTMEDAIAWSYDLLSPEEQAFFRRLSVFVGGFGLHAAEIVCGDGDETLDRIASLAGKSLMRLEPEADDEPRYRMLETIRAYAHEQLQRSAEHADVHRSHAMYYVELAELGDEAIWGGPSHRQWLDRLEIDLPNFRAAMEWLEITGDDAGFVRLAAALGGVWHYRSHRIEGREWLTRALAMGGYAAPAGRATALVKSAVIEWDLGGVPSPALAREALELRRQIGDERGIGRALGLLSGILKAQGDTVKAAQSFEEAKAIFERIGHLYGIASCRFAEGNSALQQGNPERARELMVESLELFQQDGFLYGVMGVLVALGDLEADLGFTEEAALRYVESLRLWTETRSQERLIDTLVGAGRLAATCHRPAEAARLLGAATSLASSIGYVMSPARQAHIQSAISSIRAASGEVDHANAWQAGADLAFDAVLAEATDVLTQLSESRAPSEVVTSATPGGLTPREVDVVRLLASGRSNREIARELFVSQSTANTHVHHILAKLDLDSRSAVAAWAVRNGLD